MLGLIKIYIFFQIRTKWLLSCMYHGAWCNDAKAGKSLVIIATPTFGSWKAVVWQWVFFFSEVETWSHLLLWREILKCFCSWTNEKQISTNILEENCEVIEYTKLFANDHTWSESELWLCRDFLYVLILILDYFFYLCGIILYSQLGGDPVHPTPRRKQFQIYFPRTDTAKKALGQVQCCKDITAENRHLCPLLLAQ